MTENHRYEWAVTSAGKIVYMAKTFALAKRWADMRKGVYKIRRLTDEDFESTAPIGRVK